MKNHLSISVYLSLLLVVSITNAQEPLSPVDWYKDARTHRTASDLRGFAKNVIQNNADGDLLDEAYQDLLKHSNTEQQNADALAVIESAVANKPESSKAYRQGMLAKGKLLKRLGRDDDSEALFQNAVEQQWQHAMWRYSESLIDNGELDRACQLEFDRVTGKGGYKHYRAEREDFSILVTLLRMMKNDNPNLSAVDAVYSGLEESDGNPQAKKIAHALCLSEDGRYAEAVEILNEVDGELAETRSARADVVMDEYRNTPIYLTSALLYQGEDLDAASGAFHEFMRRNDGDWKYIYDKSMRIARDLEMDVHNDVAKAQIMTAQLLRSGIIRNEEVKKTFSIDDIASLYDMHQQSLAWGGRLDESAQICKIVMENYYPQTLAGANCAMNWARYISSAQGKVEEAKGILLGILADAPFDEITPWVKLSLAEVFLVQEDRFKALAYTDEVMQQVDASAKGSVARCRALALELRETILTRSKN